MVFVSVEHKGAYRCLKLPGELDTQKSCAIHLKQPHYHNVCRPYWLWQHADPQQNAREQLAVDESPT